MATLGPRHVVRSYMEPLGVLEETVWGYDLIEPSIAQDMCLSRWIQVPEVTTARTSLISLSSCVLLTSVVPAFPFGLWGLLIKAEHCEKGYPYS